MLDRVQVGSRLIKRLQEALAHGACIRRDLREGDGLGAAVAEREPQLERRAPLDGAQQVALAGRQRGAVSRRVELAAGGGTEKWQVPARQEPGEVADAEDPMVVRSSIVASCGTDAAVNDDQGIRRRAGPTPGAGAQRPASARAAEVAATAAVSH